MPTTSSGEYMKRLPSFETDDALDAAATTHSCSSSVEFSSQLYTYSFFKYIEYVTL